MSTPLFVTQASGLSGQLVNILKEKLTDEEMHEFLSELEQSWQEFQNEVKKQEGKYKWAIHQAKLALMKSTTLTDDQKLEAISLIDKSSQGPSLLYAFFSNVNIMALFSMIVIMVYIFMG